ncbi:MAG: group II intron reverse transcriptase/maturase [Candidatus Eisenbacteria bacterium]
MRQKSIEQMELALDSRGEAPRSQRSGEARTTPHGDDRSGDDHRLMERVVERVNALAALKRVRQNKGSPGVDGMTVGELPPYLVTHWEGIREQLLAGNYQPQPVRRHDIPKPGGGTRQLGIPTVLDRFIQQCLLQVLQPQFDPTFSEHSHGFRPGRSAHDAVRSAQRYIQSGLRWVADVDLAKFFDRVNHDVLMERLSRRVTDGRVLGLIRRYLVAGVLTDGVVVERHEGTPQGGPLSPLLANVLLDEVDKALEKRGLAFARYADDLNVYTGSRRAADDAMATLKRLFARLRLQVNDAKSAVARAWERKFLGYSFWVAPGRVIRYRVAPAALAEMKDRVRVITSRTGGKSLTRVAEELRSYLTGWKLYFQLAETPSVFQALDEWLRRRLRAVQLKQWKRGSTVYRELRARDVPERVARAAAAHAKRWWAMAAHGALQTALPNSYLDRLGVPRLAGRR